MRRPIQITRAHFDFDSNPTFGLADLADEFNRSRVYNGETKRCLGGILAQLIDLYIVLTDILMLVFPLDDTPGWGRDMNPEDVGRVKECKMALRRWNKDSTLRFPMFSGAQTTQSTAGRRHQCSHDSVILYTNLMYMYYHSTRVVLCHHEILHLAILQAAPNSDDRITGDLSVIYENRHELQDAASGVTECLKELVHLKLARWLPISAVACTALPLVLNILDVKLSSSANESNLDSSAASALKQHRLNILIEAMRTYQPQYDGVDWVSEIIRHIVNLAQIEKPASREPGTKVGINDWTDILASQPSSYLRLALALDLSLSKGRLPEDGDFPVSLRGLFTGGFSPLKSLVDANRFGEQARAPDTKFSESQRSNIDQRHQSQEELDSQGSNQSPTDSYMTKSDEAAHEVLRDQIRSCIRLDRPAGTNMPPSEGLDGLGPLGNDVFSLDESPNSTSDFGGMYIDGPMPDVSAEWIENLWGEMGEMEDKTDRDTARVLLEALKEGDMGECVR
ncbi:Cutinase transcription factor 1 beta-like protein [Emericellopsis cladophorae]|uniref:Cutinase transcription factor 1 beta-like protein n=1 Tax=Emericellopsis cladophorae TaxID=2686198 RepID=A0A9P9Y4X8_9HYPO|nr:Cutinase transcription factor 1 beta-like protein [Emericellopsis cladophorae]KAI6783173.1 Cutinase transcription factor 1 beta-like protein [Emericellopsis cladophorae]